LSQLRGGGAGDLVHSQLRELLAELSELLKEFVLALGAKFGSLDLDCSFKSSLKSRQQKTSQDFSRRRRKHKMFGTRGKKYLSIEEKVEKRSQSQEQEIKSNPRTKRKPTNPSFLAWREEKGKRKRKIAFTMLNLE
jgi:hypothetical protein